MKFQYTKQIIASNIVCLPAFLAGCWVSWASVSLKKLMETGPDIENVGFKLTNYEMSWMASLLDLGNSASPIITSLLMDKIGRKNSLLISSVFNFIPLLIIIEHNVMYLYISRFCVGFAKGMAFTILPLYISEFSSTSIRGTLVSLVIVQLHAGMLICLAIGPLLSYTTLNIVLITIPIIFFILFVVFIPESPYYLASKGNIKDSKISLKWFRNKNDDVIQDELTKIIQKTEEDSKISNSFKELFYTPTNRRALQIVLLTSFIQRAGGITALVVFGSKTFPETTYSWIGPDHSAIIIMISTSLSSMIQFTLPDLLGRRTVLAYSSFLATLVFSLIAIYFLIPSIDYSIVVYIFIIIYGLAFFGISTIPAVLLGELFPINIKCKASALASVALSAGSFITLKFHLLIATNYNTSVLFFIYSFVNFILFIYTLKFIFETKQKTFEEIQVILMEICGSGEKKESKLEVGNSVDKHSKF